jgi:hypothetical protein
MKGKENNQPMSTPHGGNNKIILERIALTNSRDTTPIRPTTNQALCPQNTGKV